MYTYIHVHERSTVCLVKLFKLFKDSVYMYNCFVTFVPALLHVHVVGLGQTLQK